MSSKKKKPKKEKKAKSKIFEHGIMLKIAKKQDFLEIDEYTTQDGKGRKSWKIIKGFPFWLINSKGQIENKNYILDKYTDLQTFSDWLVREQVLILKQ